MMTFSLWDMEGWTGLDGDWSSEVERRAEVGFEKIGQGRYQAGG